MAELLEIIQPKKTIKIAVMGAGNGGQAMAGFLALGGFPVSVWNRPGTKIEALKEIGSITIEGKIDGFAVPQRFSCDIEEVIEGARLIMVTVPASAHRIVARAMAPYVKDGQIIVLNPGRTGGALEFRKTLRSSGNKSDFTVAEAGTFIYASRTIEPGRSRIFGVKKRVPVAALPSRRTMEVVRLLRYAFPQFSPVENVLVTSFDNIGAIFHPTPVLLNAGRVEYREVYEHYKQGITPAIAEVLEKMDAERVDCARALGVWARTAVEWLKDTYGVSSDTLYGAIQETDAYDGIQGPQSLTTRYIYEDVPFSLVPMVSLGQLAGVKTPVLKSVVNLASAMLGEDYWTTGRTAKDMGIDFLSPKEIVKLVMEGE